MAILRAALACLAFTYSVAAQVLQPTTDDATDTGAIMDSISRPRPGSVKRTHPRRHSAWMTRCQKTENCSPTPMPAAAISAAVSTDFNSLRKSVPPTLPASRHGISHSWQGRSLSACSRAGAHLPGWQSHVCEHRFFADDACTVPAAFAFSDGSDGVCVSPPLFRTAGASIDFIQTLCVPAGRTDLLDSSLSLPAASAFAEFSR